MFKKLRNHIILINALTTGIILFAAFAIVYIIAAHGDGGPHFHMENGNPTFSEEVNEYIEDRFALERQASLQRLLLSLVITGSCIEIIVVIVSFFLAEEAIKPVKETYEAQKAFVANASHEIKTPLAIIQANLEAADIQGNKWLDNIAIKVEDLASLNNQLLTLARLDATPSPEEKKNTHLLDFVKDQTLPLEPQLEAKSIKVKISTKNLKKKEQILNQSALKQILGILLDNAIKYCEKSISIVISEEGGKTNIAIKNDGTTIPAEKLPHLFDRFYQVDKTKNGVGLGLSIAKQLADTNHWKLTPTSDKSSTTFTLTI